MYVCIWLSVSVYVCVINTVYLVFSKMEDVLYDSLLLLLLLLRLFSTLHSTCGCFRWLCQRMGFSDCWMWFYWERSSVDWLFVRVNLKKKKKRPYYLIFSVVRSLSRSGRVEPWFYGEALPSWAGCFISFCLTDVASLLLLLLAFIGSKWPKLQHVSWTHMQTSSSLDTT